MKEIGSYEAKTHLSRLLRDVAKGQCYSITNKGRAIAMLVPVKSARPSPAQVIEQIRSLRKGITLGDIRLKDLIEEGRK